MKTLCYVGACGEPTVIGARHKFFGLVASCAGHNPIKHAYDAPLLTVNADGAPVVVLPEYREINERGSGGDRVPVERPDPKLPPAGNAAVLDEIAF